MARKTMEDSWHKERLRKASCEYYGAYTGVRAPNDMRYIETSQDHNTVLQLVMISILHRAQKNIRLRTKQQ